MGSPVDEVKEFRRLGPPVQAVYRITLPERDGQVLPGDLRGAPAYTFGIGASLVLDVGRGLWMSRDDIEEMGTALIGTERVSVTGSGVPWGDFGSQDEHAVRGLAKIAFALEGSVHRAIRRLNEERRAASDHAA